MDSGFNIQLGPCAKETDREKGNRKLASREDNGTGLQRGSRDAEREEVRRSKVGQRMCVYVCVCV